MSAPQDVKGDEHVHGEGLTRSVETVGVSDLGSDRKPSVSPLPGVSSETNKSAVPMAQHLGTHTETPASYSTCHDSHDKADYVEAIQALGEEPPSNWTVPELRARLTELREYMGLQQGKKSYTPFKSLVVEMNRASRKKSELQVFAKDKMGVPVNGNETIPQLQKACLYKAYMMSPPTGTDPVGFGMHAALTYEEVLHSHGDYIQWVTNTASEGPCDYRLSRLAAWVNMMQEKGAEAPMPKATSKPKANSKKGTSAPSQGSGTSTGSNAEMIQMIKALQEEVLELRQERPRKKTGKEDDTMSVPSSFDVIPQ